MLHDRTGGCGDNQIKCIKRLRMGYLYLVQNCLRLNKKEKEEEQNGDVVFG